VQADGGFAACRQALRDEFVQAGVEKDFPLYNRVLPADYLFEL
jgi:hypothetical protein